MKGKKIIGMALGAITVLSLVFSASFAVFADKKTDSVKTEQTETADIGAVEESVKRFRGGKHGKNKTAEPENAIGKDAAKEKAIADAGVTLDESVKVKARLKTLEDGTVAYKVSFTADGIYRSYKIDAVTGEILDKTEMSAEEHEAAKEAKKSETKSENADPDAKTDAESEQNRHGKNKRTASGESDSESSAGTREGKTRKGQGKSQKNADTQVEA